ncbi:MAG: hypothetical protein JXA73_18840 [Acidobacteria bacterium]|nr:hypothetical protein [Acidobacteriota bacterium]
MKRILIIETASPKRIRHKLDQILKTAVSPKPDVGILCRESNRAAYRDRPGVAIYALADDEEHALPKELEGKIFDTVYAFWTGEKRYRRMKLLAWRLKAAERLIIAGDENEFRLTWKAVCRHALFRWRHPLPTDHWNFVLRPAKIEAPETEPEAQTGQVFHGEHVLILQTAEPPFVLQALDRLNEKPLFSDPCYTLFCRNRPEVVDKFRGHPMLSRIRIHSEAGDSWKHLRELRRAKFDAIVLFLTGDPSYWKLKLFALLLGVPLRRILIFNEGIDCFYFNYRQWFALIIHRMQSRPMPQAGSKWSHSARILLSLLLKSVVLPFRFLWLLLVWLRLRYAALRYSRKNDDDSLRLPLFPGT